MVGASNKVASIGGQVFANLVRAFSGPVHPVNARESEVQGVTAYPTVTDLAEPVDLAVIAVPAERVPVVIQECADRGVGGALIITSGFAETGAEGAQLHERVGGHCP